MGWDRDSDEDYDDFEDREFDSDSSFGRSDFGGSFDGGDSFSPFGGYDSEESSGDDDAGWSFGKFGSGYPFGHRDPDEDESDSAYSSDCDYVEGDFNSDDYDSDHFDCEVCAKEDLGGDPCESGTLTESIADSPSDSGPKSLEGSSDSGLPKIFPPHSPEFKDIQTRLLQKGYTAWEVEYLRTRYLDKWLRIRALIPKKYSIYTMFPSEYFYRDNPYIPKEFKS